MYTYKNANCTYESLYKLVVASKDILQRLNKYYYSVIEQVVDRLQTSNNRSMIV